METEKRMELVNVIVEEVRPLLRGNESKKLVDYGSGSGLVSLELTDLVDSIVLVDSSKQALQDAEDKISARGITNCEVLYSDFTEDMPELQADIVFVSLVLLHIPDTKLILQKLFSILPTDGQLIIVDFDKNKKVSHPKIHSGFTHNEIKNILTEVGFTSSTCKTFYHGKQLFTNQDASMFIATSGK
ncbi:hypothetical protein CSV61_08905 [Sporosarcina sp. P3]|uniref:class I SAM-dependent methyltransferase n=1 Tax=Sporosarcina sp. P3 TaxID=2048245 RepID=UPI000C16D487|nr:methyltransferase domain-containing protein [Sporosarcina sp. P3]PID21343.1 hypothetical protein CSV61_08905 [Sporosarcina sp. P3]